MRIPTYTCMYVCMYVCIVVFFSPAGEDKPTSNGSESEKREEGESS